MYLSKITKYNIKLENIFLQYFYTTSHEEKRLKNF